MILTADEVRDHLRYDADEMSDDEATGFIKAAEQSIKNYITDEFDDTNDSMKLAAKLLIGFYDQYRNAEQDAPANGNYMPAQAQALLWPYRSPTAI